VTSPPTTVRCAGVVVVAQGVAALVVAVALVIRGIGGGEQKVAFGTAAWFAMIGAGVLAAGWALITGRRWGRGIAVFANLLLLPVAWYMAVGSHRLALGVPVAAAAVAALVLLFSRSSLNWFSGYRADSANSDSADPDTR
jgi:hypothetical protein